MIDHDYDAHSNERDKALWSSIKPHSRAVNKAMDRFYRKRAERHAGMNFYVASKTRHAEMWKRLRARGLSVVSTWIDEAGEGETWDYTELWTRIEREVKSADAVLFYADGDDSGWKGVYIEAGVAIGNGIPVYMILDGIELEGITFRPVGSWIKHPLVKQVKSIAEIPGWDKRGADSWKDRMLGEWPLKMNAEVGELRAEAWGIPRNYLHFMGGVAHGTPAYVPPKQFTQTVVKFGEGKVGVGPASNAETGEVSLAMHELDTAKTIGERVNKGQWGNKLVTDRDHVMLKFSNVESLDIVVRALGVVRKLLTGELTWRQYEAAYHEGDDPSQAVTHPVALHARQDSCINWRQRGPHVLRANGGEQDWCGGPGVCAHCDVAYEHPSQAQTTTRLGLCDRQRCGAEGVHE